MKRTTAMSSIQQTFAPNSQSVSEKSETNWESVPRKSRKKPQKFNSKAGFFEVSKVSEAEVDISDKMSIKSERSDKTTASDDTRSNKPREPRRPPTGIYVNLGPEWKKLVRGLVPNNLAGGKAVRDETILDEIGKIKRNPQVLPFEFKKIVCMFLHQAIKTDRNTLIERIINQWSAARYNPIELIDSIYDGCRPMTQACWSGSILSIKTIVSADTTGQILLSVHPNKGETILETLAKGKIYALEKDPSSALFIIDKFEKCERYIRDAMSAIERRDASAAADSHVESKQNHDPKIIEEIELMKSTGDIVNELSFKLAELFLSDQTSMTKYFGAIKTIVDKEIVEQIKTNLANEGIDLV